METLNAQLQGIANGYTDSKNYAGIGWHIEKAGKVIAQGTAGTSDVDGSTPLKEDAIYRIYSMTKPVVSVMALLLIQRGQMRLSDFLMQYIPAFAESKVICAGGSEPPIRPITIEDLLTHRSGISYDFVPDCPVGKQYLEADLLHRVELSLAEFADRIASFPLAFQPGDRWNYSYSTDVLARVLEVVSGQSLDQLLQQNIFTPLGMGDTGFYVPDDQQHRLLPFFGLESIDLSF
jgi:CubicO group peptidase (beta-lactamase class C family)